MKKFASILFLASLGFVFGTKLPASIVGGRHAAEGQFPHQVSLRFTDKHYCGGSIITSNYVLTAAHCVHETQHYSIRAGSVLANSGGVIVSVSAMKLHPMYKGSFYDVALLKLASPLTFNEFIHPIALENEEVPSGAKVTISGWGALWQDGPFPNELQYNILNVMSSEECERRLGYQPVTVICMAHASGDGACVGDSGGPAVYNGKLVGVANYVLGDCGSGYPDGYANVTLLGDWIKQNSDLNEWAKTDEEV